MYIIKNAFRCIGRSKGRNLLIGIIVLVIAVSSCIGLSIKQAAINAKEETLNNLTITATISFDRQSMMNEMRENMGSPDSFDSSNPPSFDRSQFKEMMGASSSLTLEEYETYATAESVKYFYYTLTTSVNGSKDFEPVSNSYSEDDSNEDDTSSDSQNQNMFGNGQDMQMPGGFGGKFEQMFGAQSDFTLTGYSSDSAMTSFINGTTSIVEGSVFEENTSEHVCMISEELATFNNLSLEDTIIITNPNSEEETYELKIVGIYDDSSANESSFSMMGSTSTDPVNNIYMSATALSDIIASSSENSETQTDDNTGREYETALTETLSGTYVFDNSDDYYKFEDEVRTLGLDDSYTVSSSDISSYEESLTPLNTLSEMAGYFLIVILIIGAIILIVLNIFNVRDRKYDIGVLTAMGMKKGKVSLQFLIETFTVTILSVIFGILIGAVCSVPVTNILLENQVNSEEEKSLSVKSNFGRDNMAMPGGMPGGDMPGGDMPGGGFRGNGGMSNNPFTNLADKDTRAEYISEINSAMNFTVVLQMLGIAILLTLISSMVSTLFVMRYDPLKILANRD
ncbi:MAG: ABC transporter permease [Lachnospiraceae bacterium]|nr:ABC transporter permease [Lachnospiraceae bacterium]